MDTTVKLGISYQNQYYRKSILSMAIFLGAVLEIKNIDCNIMPFLNTIGTGGGGFFN
jgi:hypothetical protein